MPQKCCVPNCRGNYDEKEKVSVFHFPTDEERRRVWLNKIPRDNFTPNSRTVVCERHFDKSFIVRIDSVTRPDGSILSVERDRPKLTPDAYPSIFPNCPYLSVSVPSKRKAPDDRRKEILERDNDSFVEWLEADKIKDFNQFSFLFQSKVDKNLWFYRLCGTHDTENSRSRSSTSSLASAQCWSFYRIQDNADSNPHLTCTLKIFSDLHVEIFTEKIGNPSNLLSDSYGLAMDREESAALGGQDRDVVPLFPRQRVWSNAVVPLPSSLSFLLTMEARGRFHLKPVEKVEAAPTVSETSDVNLNPSVDQPEVDDSDSRDTVLGASVQNDEMQHGSTGPIQPHVDSRMLPLRRLVPEQRAFSHQNSLHLRCEWCEGKRKRIIRRRRNTFPMSPKRRRHVDSIDLDNPTNPTPNAAAEAAPQGLGSSD